MSRDSAASTSVPHTRLVRSAHWIVTASFLVLLFTGIEILMVHPRLYWGEVGNDLTPALLELPISRNYKHGGWKQEVAYFNQPQSPVSAIRTYDIFNQNGWGRSLHFLGAWAMVVTGAAYLLGGVFSGHFRSNLIPRRKELAPPHLRADFINHLRLRIRTATGGPQYGMLQKCAYACVVFILLPGIAVTGFTMSPAITAAHPWLLDIFGGYQSARTIHFFLAVALVLFVAVHIVMVIKSGFRRQMRAMTLGEPHEKRTTDLAA